MIKEIDDHSDGEHWEIINRSEMPRNARTILMIVVQAIESAHTEECNGGVLATGSASEPL
jgi:hypothetical protein